ncbi:hypothetical protein V8G61_14080 [Gaetbulibacter sp. M240]|uniref:hypothetical protein n=1 Tax=Gaetbulibacter sp. M240 TaxID=3126511 RepID=UPI00374F830B
MKLMKIPQAKKAKYQTVFWYFYGIVLILSGVVNLMEKDTISWVFIVELILGLIILILNILGKLNNKTA